MEPANAPASVFSDSKKHYQILDALRGIAALMVVIFHLFEAFALGDPFKQVINHGYLAVDFFFLLSGFVMGYAYDDRWGTMSLGSFAKRRIIRLHPMIIMGMVIGALEFYACYSPTVFPMVNQVPVSKVLLIMLIGFVLIPVPLSMDIRGWGDMYPLNGPAWSLFFEYIANILYALFIRKFSKTALSVLVFIAGAALIHLAVTSPRGDVIGGWTFEPGHLRIGITRLMYPFFAGLLLSRICKPGHIKHAFLWCSALLIIILSIPRVGGHEHVWLNGLYDSLTIILLFPIIVYIGASGGIRGKFLSGISKFLADISYTIYITHYPLIYIFTARMAENKLTFKEAWPQALLVLVVSIAIAYGCVKLYDVPVRRWLTTRFIIKASQSNTSR